MFNNETDMIRNEIIRFYRKDKCFDEKAVEKLVNSIIRKRKLQNYFTKVNYIKELEEDSSGSYNFLTKEMDIKHYEEDKESPLDYNLSLIHTILHECEHIGQYKLCKTGRPSLKKSLLKESLSDMILCEQINNALQSETLGSLTTSEKIKLAKKMYLYDCRRKISKEIYLYKSSERMAEIDSFKRILKILKPLQGREFDEEKDIYVHGYHARTLLGYKKKNNSILTPVILYYFILNESIYHNDEATIKIINNLYAHSSSMNLNERLYYGFPIEFDEYEKTLQKTRSNKNY